MTSEPPWTDLPQFLRVKGVAARFHHFPEKTTTVAAAVSQLGTDAARIVKTIVLITDAGTPLIGMVPGNTRVDWTKLRTAAGVGNLRLATREEVYQFTGYPAGGTPPLGHKSAIPTFMDPAVLARPSVIGGGGEHNVLVELDPHDILRLSGAVVAPIAT